MKAERKDTTTTAKTDICSNQAQQSRQYHIRLCTRWVLLEGSTAAYHIYSLNRFRQTILVKSDCLPGVIDGDVVSVALAWLAAEKQIRGKGRKQKAGTDAHIMNVRFILKKIYTRYQFPGTIVIYIDWYHPQNILHIHAYTCAPPEKCGSTTSSRAARCPHSFVLPYRTITCH